MAGVDIADKLATPGLVPASALGWAEPPSAIPRIGRRRGVLVAKYLLPVMGIALLSSIAAWPEIARHFDHNRITWRQASGVVPASGHMIEPRYHGIDERQQPYTVSATTADRAGPTRVNLAAPVGDLTLANGTWLLLRAKQGVFVQHSNELDLSRDVTLYRQDGTIMTSATATMNLRQGAASSDSYTHAEGPFGTLDAQGFTIVDKGTVVQFHGPAKLVLNGGH